MYERKRIWKFPEAERTVQEYYKRHREWLKEYYGTDDYDDTYKEDRLSEFDIDHENIIKEFPYILTVETDHYSMNYIDNLARSFLGHEHGECHWKKCKDANLNFVEIRKMAEYMKKEYNDSVSVLLQDIREDIGIYTYGHSHKGQWNSRYIVKTGYDFGFMNYYFKDPAHIERLRIACTLDENYMIL